MNTPEPRTDPSPFPADPLCGTTSTPQCPNNLVYDEFDLLISRLAGPKPTPEKLRAASERVNNYLSGVLQSGLRLVGGSFPEALPLYELRSELIYQLAGTRTDLERINEATEQVDDYLLGELQSALLLTRSIVDRSNQRTAGGAESSKRSR